MACTTWTEVISYWCDGDAGFNMKNKWFGAPPSVDEEIRTKFSDLVEKALNNELLDWEDDPDGAFALLVLLDQFPRTLFKGTAKAFAGEARALRIAKMFIGPNAKWNHKDRSFAEKQFVYLPLEHHENKESQELSVKLYEEFVEDYKGTENEWIAAACLKYAIVHKELIDQFGRYPHRNAALGRTNTTEEEEFLANIPAKYRF
ncbi:uncharacterized protein LOC106155934 [Lingula anatina]|uniref:Uncharacterized protein LOC106155934 n=1 Tax=Lingula anatina TaxID=7574 RepID=A0A1S3HN11_LINAN|nr:uncharacterized protein LOC106155934 [Lingula anatina]|eukprot:XP_013386429.1 uncharacterized protein LOC106155934 [Lingula anatina]